MFGDIMKNQNTNPKTEANENEQICKNCKFWKSTYQPDWSKHLKKFGICRFNKIRDLFERDYDLIESDEVLYVENPTTLDIGRDNKPLFGERFGCIHFQRKEFIK